MPTLDVVIVNYNSGDDLRTCVEALLTASESQDLIIQRIVVVDNASSDDSIKQLEQTGRAVHLIHNVSNRGFATACNQGAQNSTAEFLL